MKPGVNACTLCLGMALSAALPASASPFSVGLPASAEQGTSITASLLDGGVTELEAADLLLTFDSKVFSFLGATTGSATSGFSLVPGDPVPLSNSLWQVEFSLATGGTAVDGISGALIEVGFMIRSGKSVPLGPSAIFFASKTDSDGKADPDYLVPEQVGWINVTQGALQPVPEPISSTLVGMGLLALSGWSRRLR